MALDVTDLASINAAAKDLDGEPIDLLVNNAGVGGQRRQTLGNIDYAAWASVLYVDTLGPLRVPGALIDNVARSLRDLDERVGDNTSGGAFAYRSSKAAVNMAMRSLAVDLAPRGITCVVVNPGWVRTDMGGPDGVSARPRAWPGCVA